MFPFRVNGRLGLIAQGDLLSAFRSGTRREPDGSYGFDADGADHTSDACGGSIPHSGTYDGTCTSFYLSVWVGVIQS
jgi:hypothetical protein